MLPLPARRRHLGALLLILLVTVGLVGFAPATPATGARPVTPALALSAPKATLAFGKVATLRLGVRRGAPRQQATLEWKDGARWRKVATKRLPRTGAVKRATFKVKVTWGGQRSFRVRLAGTRTVRAATSRAVVVKGRTDTRLASDGGPGAAVEPSVSADGRYVVFSSTETYAGQAVAVRQVFLRDRDTGQVTLVSHDRDGEPGSAQSRHPVISANGRYVAFETTSALLPTDQNGGRTDVYRWDRTTDVLVAVSAVGTETGGVASESPSISADGRRIAFTSGASSFGTHPGGPRQVFLWKQGATEPLLISRDDQGAVADDDANDPAISPDGGHVAYETAATNLVEGTSYVDLNLTGDVYLWSEGETTPRLVSTKPDGLTAPNAPFGSGVPSVSEDARFVAFQSSAVDLVGAEDDNRDVFLWSSTAPGSTKRITNDDRPADRATISADGTRIAFIGDWTSLTGRGDSSDDDAILWVRGTASFTRLSVPPGGAETDADVLEVALSADGRWAVFDTAATNLTTTPDPADTDVYLRGPLP